jgi:uncharacterized protein (TIGR00255 family)
MMTSMTGFSALSAELKGYRLCLEARSLNHRFFEFKVRMPSMLSGMDLELEALAKKMFERGKVELNVTIESEPEQLALSWSRPRARAYLQIFSEIKKELSVAGEADLGLLVDLKDDIIVQSGRWGDDARPELEKIFKQCFEGLAKARRDEGERLEADLKARTGRINELFNSIAAKRDEIASDARAKLKRRVEQLLSEGIAFDQGRLEQELAILGARSDISEELDRIGSHLKQFSSEMKEPGAKGKKMDFLTQELNREFNTIGTKAQNTEVSRWVIEAKTELERIRQQLQNIE